MRNAPIVQGTPNPYFYQYRNWPSLFHGPRYARPVFSGKTIARTQNVMTRGYDIDRQVAQPTISGLGDTVDAGMLWETNGGVFQPGGYGGGVFDGNISGLGSIGARGGKKRRRGYNLRGLGDDATDYPWKVKTDATKTLQVSTNASLVKAGMCPIVADGKLGPATCGARNYLTVNSQQVFGQEMVFANPSTCDGHENELVRPKSAAGGGCSSGTSIKPLSPLPEPAIVDAGMSSSTKRALGFALGGVLAIGAVVMLRRKK